MQQLNEHVGGPLDQEGPPLLEGEISLCQKEQDIAQILASDLGASSKKASIVSTDVVFTTGEIGTAKYNDDLSLELNAMVNSKAIGVSSEGCSSQNRIQSQRNSSKSPGVCASPSGNASGIPAAHSKSKAMRAAHMMKCDGSLHPIVRMGWQPMCKVVCNGLYGIFYGGHDRDVYIQCTSPPYAGLPLVDVSYGGCIMTCSHFERIAGRELSKKWKESIHVVGEGGGSKSTMLAWLKKVATQRYGDGVVGKSVWVCWCADSKYYQGNIVKFNNATGKHTVEYSPNLTEELHLPLENIDFGASEPPLPSMEPSSLNPSRTTNTWKAANPIWNQGSDVSITTSLMEEFQHQTKLQNPAHGVGASAGGNRTRARRRSEREEFNLPKSPSPKRATSAPATVLQQLSAFANRTCDEKLEIENDVMTARDTHQKQDGMQCLRRQERRYANVPIPPTWSPPESQDSSVEDFPLHDAVLWMHRLALALDDALLQMTTPFSSSQKDHAPAQQPANNTAEHAISPSAQFQAIIALSSVEQKKDLFIALQERYRHFNSNIDVLKRKMAEFLVSTASNFKNMQIL